MVLRSSPPSPAGSLIGAFNGVFVAFLGVPSLLVTLGALFLFQGVGYAVTSGFSFAATKAVRREFIYNAVGGGGFAGVNASVIWALVVLVGASTGGFRNSGRKSHPWPSVAMPSRAFPGVKG